MKVKAALDKFYEFLDRPIYGWGRVLLALAVIPLVLSFWKPLWSIELEAPQYPKGLQMEIYTHKLEGGNNGQHIHEINTLNHYIGMHKIDREELSDLDWMPFAIGFLIIFGLRTAAIGNVRSLVDLAVLTTYIGGFAFARFVYKLYVFGHQLDPTAPVKVPPFTPAIVGTKQIANFTTTSLPATGTYLIGAFITTVIGVTLWHLVAGRLAAVRREREAASAARAAKASV